MKQPLELHALKKAMIISGQSTKIKIVTVIYVFMTTILMVVKIKLGMIKTVIISNQNIMIKSNNP